MDQTFWSFVANNSSKRSAAGACVLYVPTGCDSDSQSSRQQVMCFTNLSDHRFDVINQTPRAGDESLICRGELYPTGAAG